MSNLDEITRLLVQLFPADDRDFAHRIAQLSTPGGLTAVLVEHGGSAIDKREWALTDERMRVDPTGLIGDDTAEAIDSHLAVLHEWSNCIGTSSRSDVATLLLEVAGLTRYAVERGHAFARFWRCQAILCVGARRLGMDYVASLGRWYSWLWQALGRSDVDVIQAELLVPRLTVAYIMTEKLCHAGLKEVAQAFPAGPQSPELTTAFDLTHDWMLVTDKAIEREFRSALRSWLKGT